MSIPIVYCRLVKALTDNKVLKSLARDFYNIKSK